MHTKSLSIASLVLYVYTLTLAMVQITVHAWHDAQEYMAFMDGCSQ